MAGINFKGVSEVREKSATRPGTIGVYKISDVKFDTTKIKGTYYMGVTFTSDNDEFNHSFFLSEGALPRVKTLVKHVCGTELDTEVSEEKLIAMLKGKQIALKVTARIDETNGRAYPDLLFAGFSKPAADVGLLSFTAKEQELNAKAAEIYASRTADAPTKTTSATTETVADEIF
jgi:hypothetical protein